MCPGLRPPRRVEDLRHMVATTEAQLLQRRLHRQRPRPRQPGADHLQRRRLSLPRLFVRVGDGSTGMLPLGDHGPEVVGGVHSGERGVGDWPAEEAAQRRPPFGRIIDQQPVRRNRAADLVVVPAVAVEHVGLVAEPRVGSPAHCVDHAQAAPRLVEACGPARKDRVLGRGEPALLVALAEHHLGVGIVGRQLAVEVAGRRVSGRSPVREDAVPVHGPAARGGLPQRPVLRVLQRLAHVVAGPQAQLFERQFQ